MKIIQQTTLHYLEGSSRKAYEIQLVELIQSTQERYLVNFRYGRLGSQMREGTKTTQTVSLAEAQAIYLSLVISKTNKGYQIVSGLNPLPSSTQSVLSATIIDETEKVSLSSSALDKRRYLILAHLQNYNPNTVSKQELLSVQRLIWRCGELELKASCEILVKWQKLAYQHELLAYSLAWALGRCGHQHPQSYQALQTLASHPQIYVQRMARQSLVAIAGTVERQQLLTDAKQQILIKLNKTNAKITALEQLEWKVLEQFLLQLRPLPALNETKTRYQRTRHVVPRFVATQEVEGHLSAAYLYLLAHYEYPTWQQELLKFFQNFQIKPHNAWIWRVFFKMAEFQKDWSLLARLIKSLETSPKQFFSYYKAQENIFLENTHFYFKRRSWRILRRFGELDNSASAAKDFAGLAYELLVLYKDPPRPQQTEQVQATTASPFSTHQAFNGLLYNRHKQAQQRSEAFPHYWDKHPEKLWQLLLNSHCTEVHAVFSKALTAQAKFLKQCSLADWLAFFEHTQAYESSLEAGFQAIQNYQAQYLTELKLLTLLLDVPATPVRSAAIQYLKQLSTAELTKQATWLKTLLTSSFADNRQVACELLQGFDAYPEFKADLLSQLLSYAQSFATDLNKPAPSEIVTNLRFVFSHYLQAELAQLSLSTAHQYLISPIELTQQIGAEILLAKGLAPDELPVETYEAILNSPYPAVQAASIRLLAGLNDTDLVATMGVIIDAALNPQWEVRQAVEQLFTRLATRPVSVLQAFLQAIIPHLFAAEPAEGVHKTLVTLVTKHLTTSWPQIDKDLLWRLLHAQSKAAQQVGTAILLTRSPLNYSVRQWAQLAKHSALAVRQWVWKVYQEQVERIRLELDDGLRILDTDWDDTRQFALSYFRQHFSTEQDWTTERLILLCDNVRADVQTLGRDLLMHYFQHEQGLDYLLKLSQHPSQQVQLFSSQFLQNYASANPAIQQQLKPYFITVLSAVNQGRIMKERVLSFLLAEAKQQAETAGLVMEILTRQSVTIALQDKERLISALRDLSQQYPHLTTPLTIKSPRIRGFNPKATEV